MIDRKTLAIALIGAGALCAVVSSANAQSAANPVAGEAAGAFAGTSDFGEKNGEAMYKNVCAACHMPNGEGAVGAGFYPALAKNEKLVVGGYPVLIVMKGYNGMPPLGDQMSDQQVADVVNYVRTHFGNKYKDAVVPADVAALR